MTTSTIRKLPNGDEMEIRTNPGAAPIVFINGVLQPRYRGPQGPWQPVFTWRPRRINGRWYWLTTVYKREKNRIVWPSQGYEYGDVFDVLKDE